MENERYRVVFKGDLLPDAELVSAKQKLAALYKIGMEKIEPLFSGKPVTLKDNLTMEEARNFITRFQSTGAKCYPVKKHAAAPAKPQAPQQTAPPKPAPATFHEARYSVKFNGEMVYGSNPDDVKMKLCTAFKASLPQIETLFTGNSVTIKEATDFLTAADLMNRFKSCGALCNLEIIHPSGKTAPPPVQRTPQVQQTPAAVAIPAAATTVLTGSSPPPAANETQSGIENEQLKKESATLRDSISSAYQRVLMEFKIESRNKRFETNETAIGCFFLLIAAALIIAVIYTRLKWWEGLLLALGSLVILGVFTKNWDLKYADTFLTRIQFLGRDNPALFLATLHSWAAGLDKTDRARQHLLEQIQKSIDENEQTKAEVEKTAEALGFTIQTAAGLSDLDDEEPEPGKPPKCPRCGSTDVIKGYRGFSWTKGILVSAVLGPLGGAIAGGSRSNEKIYICESCRKKWNR